LNKQGECAVGVATCDNGNWVGCPTPTTEICDNKDNDCDGEIDEDCDKDNDNYCDENKQIDTGKFGVGNWPAVCFNGPGDCIDDPANNPAVCNEIMCCYYDPGDSTESRFKWTTASECTKLPKGESKSDSRCEALSTDIGTKGSIMCNTRVYSWCAECINPGAKKKCGLDADCSGTIWNGIDEKEWEGLSEAEKKCNVNEQCVIYGEKRKVIHDPNKGIAYDYDSICNFLPGGTEGMSNGKNADCVVGKFYFNDKLKDEIIVDCMPDTENMVIDSFEGELDFNKFISGDNNFCREWVTNPKSDWQWKTACIGKDKCLDGVDNDGEEDIFTILKKINPKFENSITFVDREGKKTKMMGKQLPLKLVDIDDSDCYPAYCWDSDKDGWCGTKQEYGEFIGNDFETKYSQSKLFSDCDNWEGDDSYQDKDNNGKRDYVIEYEPMDPITLEKVKKERRARIPDPSGFPDQTKWSGEMIDIGASNVHPFAPLGTRLPVLSGEETPSLCNIGADYDLNCNKDSFAGYDFSQLASGGTPFDNDWSTGKEIARPLCTFSIRTDTDYLCQKQTISGAGHVILYVGKLVTATVVITSGMILFTTVLPAFIGGTATAALTIPTALLFTGLAGKQCSDAIISYYDTPDRSPNWYNAKYAAIFEQCANAVAIPVAMGVGYGAKGLSKRYTWLKKDIFPIETYVKNYIARLKAKCIMCPLKAPKPGCFLAGTPILMEDGSYKNIEDVKVDDKVLAYDVDNDAPVDATVSTTFVRNETKYRIIEYEIIEDEE